MCMRNKRSGWFANDLLKEGLQAANGIPLSCSDGSWGTDTKGLCQKVNLGSRGQIMACSGPTQVARNKVRGHHDPIRM